MSTNVDTVEEAPEHSEEPVSQRRSGLLSPDIEAPGMEGDGYAAVCRDALNR
jgi:hypothetical protein